MADFFWTPTNNTIGEPKLLVLRAQMGDGYEQIAADGINAYVETWSLAFDNIPDSEVLAIETLLFSKIGISFTWARPAPWNDTINVRSQVWHRGFVGGNIRRLTVELYRVFLP